MKGGAFSLIRRFREIVKPYLNNVARCSSDVVLFLTRHVLFLSSHLLQPISNLFEKPCCSTPCRVSRFVSALFAVPKLSGPEHIATWSHLYMSQVICQLSNLLKTRFPFQEVLGVWVYTHTYIYIYIILYRLYIIYKVKENCLCADCKKEMSSTKGRTIRVILGPSWQTVTVRIHVRKTGPSKC